MINDLAIDLSRQERFARNSAAPEITKTDWYQITAKYGRANLRKSLWQLINTLVPYLALWTLMIYTVQQEFPYWITLMLAVVAGSVLVRVFILFHDCCHGSFFASRRANRILGYVAGILTFTPFEDWRRAHNRHHATAGNLDRRGTGDVWTMTTEEYLAAAPARRFAYRFYRNPIILFGAGSLLFFLFLQRFPKKGGAKSERKSVLITNMALLLVVAAATCTMGLQTYLLVQVPVILIAGGLGLWLFYVQHQFENAYWVRHESWDPMKVALEGSSYFKLPKLLQWFTGNIGLHHIHHVRPNIPNYNLQQCQDEIPALQRVRAITFGTSIRSLRLGLYDEKNKKLVSFRSLARSRNH
jgi:omega-6 fatty acid desaturase (delta-12 desaturase)